MIKKENRSESLLHLAKKSYSGDRGKLKIFLGFAPGVGKTYAMLSSALLLQKELQDIVIGIAISHGRPETSLLMENLESVPLRKVIYKDKILYELDIEEIIKRKPDLVIIDELPRNNYPLARNKKRYLDIEEVLSAGIDVYTAINIQHIASLSLEVSQITHSPVSEVVPDSFIQSADELVVVDISPEELIKRLKQGKIYSQENAMRALDAYFKYTNLSILRDYTFRLAANHIGEDIRHYKNLYHNVDLNISAPSVLVCCSYNDATPKLLRRGKQLSKKINAKLLAIFISKPYQHLSHSSFREFRRYKILAHELGYNIEHISGTKLSSSILDYADANNVTDIVIGKTVRSKWKDLLFGSVVYDVIRNSKNKHVHVINNSIQLASKKTVKKNKKVRTEQSYKLKDIIYSGMITIISGLFIHFSLHMLGLAAQSLSLLLVIMICAYFYNLRASIFSSVIGFILYMYMYLTPKFNFTIGTFSQVLTFFIFIFVVLLISQLTARSRLSLIALKDKETRLSILYNFSKKLAKYNKYKEFSKVIVDTLTLNFKYKFIFIEVTNDDFLLNIYPSESNFNEKEIVAARWTWQHKSICGATTNTFSGLQWYFEPLLVNDRIFGVIAISVENKKDEINFSSDYLMIQQMLIQASQILLKQSLENEEHKFKSLEWKQKLQKSMLSSVSHDLKTPLASIMGSISSVISYQEKFSKKDQKEILEIAYKESQRLDKYVDNIMQLLKLESQGAFLNKQLIDIGKFIKEVKEICKVRFPKEKILFLEIRKTFVFSGDAILLQQVLLNIIANSVKFSIAGKSSIVISIEKEIRNFNIFIQDQGIGIKKEDLDKIFTIFYRIRKQDTYSKGNGLGLAICKGIIEAHNGDIIAFSEGKNKGTNIKITIPLTL